MERLTRRNDVIGYGYPDCEKCQSKDVCNGSSTCVTVLATRLAAYEDTGLEPEEIEELLAELVTISNQLPQWISVEERLPEEYDRVLVANDDGKFMVAERAEDDWWYQYCAYDVDRWDALEQGIIAHWMPLPSPPKGVE